MAIEVTQRRVCDICGEAQGLSSWGVRDIEAQRTVTGDLCEEHAAVLRELHKLYPKGKRGRSAMVRKVLTEDEIARRAAADRRTRKKA